MFRSLESRFLILMSIRKIVPTEQAEWRIAPPPEWIEARDPDWTFTPPEGHAVAFLLLDVQHHVATQACAQRIVRQLLTPQAVQSLGQVELEFDPAAHRLLIHELAVWRRSANGLWGKRSFLRREIFLLRQREQQLEQQMLNGRVSVVALLEDVRVGDAIELAWTLEPRDSLPGLLFTAFFAFVWTVPIARVAFTLHLSPDHPVRWKMHAPDGIARPAEEASAGRVSWRVEKPPVFQIEPNVPGGHWPFAMLDVSGWTTWLQVATFFADLWRDALADGAEEIAAEAKRLRGEGDVAHAARAAIRFVQEEIRYLAVDFGHGAGMLPNGARVVLHRRFGDCKDKTVLLVALLRSLGIEAWPLLVAPNWREAVERMQPSPACFSHAIVSFIVEGRQYFVDPTLAGQGGDLAGLVAPPFGRGLEVRSDANGLLTLPDLPPAELNVTETFDLDRKQRGGTVEQVLHASSWLADEIRAALVQQGSAAFFKVRAEALQKHFPALIVAGNGGQINDDNDVNVIVTRSRHKLPTWGPMGEKPPPMFTYGAHALFLAVELVDDNEKRLQPWALRFPMKVHHRVIVRGKCVRRTKPGVSRFSGPGFRYSCEVGGKRHEATFDYRWETTQREVAPEQWADYRRERAKALQFAGANVSTEGFRFDFSQFRRPLIFILAVPGAFMLIGFIAAIIGAISSSINSPTINSLPSAQQQQQIQNDVRAALAAAQRGDYLAAEPVLERVRFSYTGNFDFQTTRAEIALKTGHLDHAREAIGIARKLDAANLTVDLLEAVLREYTGDLAGAHQLLNGVVARAPQDNRAWIPLARIAERMGDTAAARAAWETVLSRQPAHPDALSNLARLLWQSGEHERADKLITSAINAQPMPSAVLELALAQYYTNTGRHGEALEPARRAAELAPNDAGAAYNLAMTQVRAGDKVGAVVSARRMTQMFPQSVLSWFALATTAATAGDNNTAASAFRTWLQLAPANPDAHASYGFFLHKTGQDVQAREVLAKASRDFPGHGLLWLNYAVVLEALGEKAAAADARSKANALMTVEQRASLLR